MPKLSSERREPGPRERRYTRSALWRAIGTFPFSDPDVRSRRLAARAAFWLLMGASAVFGITVGLVLVYSISLPEISELERYQPSTTTELYDIHGRVFGSFALERRIVVGYDEIPPVLREAILSVEDKTFEKNGGINPLRLVEAAYADLHSDRRAQGGSTLTMQLARNLFLSSEKTYGRKLQEVFLALQIERHFTKRQIFTLYANQIYLGRGTYGFEAGSEYYFSKKARDLTLPEAAVLAGLPKGPESYSPVRYPERALRRRNLVLDEMLADHKISAQQAAEAKAAPLGLHIEAPANVQAPYFVEEVRRQLEHDYGSDEVHAAGLRVYTTLDLDLQHAAEQALEDGLASYERRRGWRGKLENVLAEGYALDDYEHPDWTTAPAAGSYEHGVVTEVAPTKITVRLGKVSAVLTPPEWQWTGVTRGSELAKVGDIVYVKVQSIAGSSAQAELEQDSGAQAALMAVDNSNGEILAMVGGRDFNLSQFNRATQAERQVGSSFKPYVYTAAMEAGMGPYDKVLDVPTTFATAGGPYTPHNYEADYRGPMTLVDAFAESRNIPALRLADKVGIQKVIAVARRFGVTSPLPPYLPVAIGAADISLDQQVASYSVFPNDGIRIAPHTIRRVEAADGEPMRQAVPEVREVLTLPIARKMMVLLRAVVEHGTGAAASSLNHALGGKTGTTNNYTDAWFVGFSPSITCGTWVGFDSRQSLGDKETGARAALPIWMQFMKVAVADRPNAQFELGNAPKKSIDLPIQPSVDAAPAANQAPEGDQEIDGSGVTGPVVVPLDTPADSAAPAKPTESPAAPHGR